jgi:hypothetical protein
MAIPAITESQVIMEIGIAGRDGGSLLSEGDGLFAPVQHAQFVRGRG